ncbi:MAG: nuclear transport factor 2 family protein [Chitinophagaceae bacterium]
MQYLLLILTFISFSCYAQSEEEKVKKPITALFDGMRKSDSTLIRTAFAPGAIMQTIYKSKEGKMGVHTEQVDKFIVAVTKPHKEIYDERIMYDIIRIDADLAIAWTPYQFFVDDKLSHCGVNSFQLVRLNGQWKIQYIIDTRRREGCGEKKLK